MAGASWFDIDAIREQCGSDVAALADTQLKMYRDAFLKFDKDGDGQITTNEVRDVLESMGYDPDSKNVELMMQPFDQDGNGTIEFAEFLTVMSRVLEDEDTEDDLVNIFRILDQDGDGFITKSDLRECCIRVGSHLTSQDLDEMLTEADKDGDGQITYEEFLKILEARS